MNIPILPCNYVFNMYILWEESLGEIHNKKKSSVTNSTVNFCIKVIWNYIMQFPTNCNFLSIINALGMLCLKACKQSIFKHLIMKERDLIFRSSMSWKRNFYSIEPNGVHKIFLTRENREAFLRCATCRGNGHLRKS